MVPDYNELESSRLRQKWWSEVWECQTPNDSD